jgi:hypothetical protein
LARIPLYLQLIISEYQRSKELPNSRATLLRTLFQTTIQRESVRHAARVDRFGKERLLGSFAYRAISEGYSLRIPEHIVESILRKDIVSLKQAGLIQTDLVFGAIWQEILSNNFLKIVDSSRVEWLHQLIRDYFLACEIVRIRTDGDPSEIRELNERITRYTWDQACANALGLLDHLYGGRFLEDLVRIEPDIAQNAFESLGAEEARFLADSIIADIANEETPDSERLKRIAVQLPYLQVVEALGLCFRANPDLVRVGIAEAVSALVIEYSSVVAGGRFVHSGRQMADRYRLRDVVKRGVQLLGAWIGNKNEAVRFYAATGLWETDRGLSAQTLKELLDASDPEVAGKVRDVMTEWGIG